MNRTWHCHLADCWEAKDACHGCAIAGTDAAEAFVDKESYNLDQNLKLLFAEPFQWCEQELPTDL